MSRTLATAALVLATMLQVQAQWVKHPTAGVPRTKTGAVDLAAPPPRTADGKPNLSGIWKPEDNRPCPREGCNDMVVSQEFVNIGWAVKGGLPFQPWAAELTKQRMAENRFSDPNSRCLPNGIVRMHTAPLYRKVVQTPDLLVILNERNVWFRQIFTDGRTLNPDPQPTWNGYSVGKWDGDTLVVESNGFLDGLWLDSNGSPLTDAATITERFRRPNYGTLEIALRVDDPKAYTRPWETTLKQNIVLDSELLDYVCYENEKSVQHFKR
jgi:hypothetical protein